MNIRRLVPDVDKAMQRPDLVEIALAVGGLVPTGLGLPLKIA